MQSRVRKITLSVSVLLIVVTGCAPAQSLHTFVPTLEEDVLAQTEHLDAIPALAEFLSDSCVLEHENEEQSPEAEDGKKLSD